jgi:hypothetical protein
MKTFKHTYLYIKQHNVTGLKYFGKTVAKDPVKYKGSGKHWTRHLAKYGNDVTTVWFHLFDNKQQLTEYAIKFSKENNIVKSDNWANLKDEDGLWGGGVKGAKIKPHTEDHKRKISESIKKLNLTKDKPPKPDKQKLNKDRSDSGWKWQPEDKANLSTQRKGRTPWNKGKSVGSYISNRLHCTQCNGVFAPYTYNRWHGNKCKSAAFGDAGSES